MDPTLSGLPARHVSVRVWRSGMAAPQGAPCPNRWWREHEGDGQGQELQGNQSKLAAHFDIENRLDKFGLDANLHGAQVPGCRTQRTDKGPKTAGVSRIAKAHAHLQVKLMQVCGTQEIADETQDACTTLADGLKTLQVLEAALESSNSGRVVTL